MARKSNKPCLPGRQHFWVIDPANGPVSNGVCKYCKLEGLHHNYVGMGNDYERQVQWKKGGVSSLTGAV